MKKIIIISILLSIFTMPAWGQIRKSNLKILYVGGSSDTDRYSVKDTTGLKKNIGERMASFETMLKEYFNSVTVILASKYTQELSYKYDVTIMDGTPVPITPRVTERDASGKTTNTLAAGYFTEDFDRPVLTIGELGETLGRRIGLKTDWYCLCLDADAHSFRKEHPIFNGPFPLKMTIVEKPTPEDAFHYAYYSDKPLPATLPMWRVQTKGYKTDAGFRVGMVSRPWGFEDSPDAEYISSGVCAKTLDAVAIGRHGNFLHWGFAASPTYMTEEGKTVLANAIVYISKFAGQGIIARKYYDRLATREYLKELKYLSTRESYEERLKMEEDFNQMYLKKQKEAAERKERGETLTQIDEIALNFKPQPSMSFEDYIKRYQKDFFQLFGMNVKEYAKFYDANRDYFYSSGFYHLEVDEDVKSIGIPNNDKRILDEAIKMLETGKDVEKGKRILARYTLVDFASAKEWRNWFEKYKEKLFFTETGGWLFLINSREPGVNNYHAREKRIAMAEIKTGETDDRNPVSVVTGIINNKEGNKSIIIKIKIHPGYHIYSQVSNSDPFIKTDVSIDLPKGYEKAGELRKPPFKSYNQSGTTIFEGEIVYTLDITGSGTGEAVCNLSYQCCDNHICFPPENKTYTIKII
jgi:hypothetical protein